MSKPQKRNTLFTLSIQFSYLPPVTDPTQPKVPPAVTTMSLWTSNSASLTDLMVRKHMDQSCQHSCDVTSLMIAYRFFNHTIDKLTLIEQTKRDNVLPPPKAAVRFYYLYRSYFMSVYYCAMIIVPRSLRNEATSMPHYAQSFKCRDVWHTKKGQSVRKPPAIVPTQNIYI
jgi:hypothetical protein